MPFTGSHPAAVLPVLRGLPPSALGYHATRSLTGVVTVDLALRLAVLGRWHELIGPAVVMLAPRGWGGGWPLVPGGPGTHHAAAPQWTRLRARP